MRKIQIWPIESRSKWYWAVFAAGAVGTALLLGCSDSTAPTEMTQVPTDSEYVAMLKANGVGSTGGVACAPAPNGTVAQVQVCFAQLYKALAIGTKEAASCLALIAVSETAVAGAFAGSVCSLGLFAIYDGFERYVEATQIGVWANQSSEELAWRMRQEIYKRMYCRQVNGDGC